MGQRIAASEINFYDPVGHYPWWEWLNGETWKLTPGVDFTCTVEAMRSKVYHQGRVSQTRIQTRIGEDGCLYLRKYEPPA